MKNIALVTSLFALLYSCGQVHVEKSAPVTGNLILFLEARGSDGLLSHPFGDVVLMDVDKREKYFLTDDRFFDYSPTISPDGRMVLFDSNRVGGPLALKVKGAGGPHEVYVYEIDKQTSRRVDSQTSRKHRSLVSGLFQQLRWHPEGRSALFVEENALVQWDITSDSVWVFKRFEGFSRILDYSLSVHGDSVLALLSSEKGLTAILYNRRDDRTVILPDSLSFASRWINGGQTLFGWENGFVEYDLSIGARRKFRTPQFVIEHVAGGSVHLLDGRIVVLASKDRDGVPDNLLIYDPKDGSAEWLTNDSEEKGQLSLVPVRNP